MKFKPFAIAGLLVTITLGQTAPPAAAPKPAAAKTTPSKPATTNPQVDAIIESVKAGLSESLIIRTLQRENKPANLTPTDLVKLKNAGVSENIISVMLDPAVAVAPAAVATPGPPPAAPTTPTSAPVATTVAPAPPAAPAPTPAPAVAAANVSLPTGVGVFYRGTAGYIEIPQELGKGRMSLGRLMTGGIMKNKAENKVPGGTAQTKVDETRPVFLIHLPQRDVAKLEMVSMLEVRESERVFAVVEGRVTGNLRRNMVPISLNELKAGYFEMSPKEGLKNGEYAIVDYEEKDIPPRVWSFKLVR